MNLVKQHTGWVMGVALLVWAVLGMFLQKESFSQVLPDVMAGLGLLGLHFNSNL